jgi:hypothetical protein
MSYIELAIPWYILYSCYIIMIRARYLLGFFKVMCSVVVREREESEEV